MEYLSTRKAKKGEGNLFRKRHFPIFGIGLLKGCWKEQIIPLILFIPENFDSVGFSKGLFKKGLRNFNLTFLDYLRKENFLPLIFLRDFSRKKGLNGWV